GADRLATTLGIDTLATDLGGLGADFRPDAVLVCTPPASHLAVMEAALDLGAHVFCEKPLAPDLGGVAAVLTRAAAAGRLVMMGMCYRFHPALPRPRPGIEAGGIG